MILSFDTIKDSYCNIHLQWANLELQMNKEEKKETARDCQVAEKHLAIDDLRMIMMKKHGS